MSNQIVISSGAKVRNLGGVLTATAGVVSSVGYGTANGVATLDANGKVPLSQLPASVVTYLGTWNASTNTPTLANGTGDIGDLYICNVAGTVNFGAGPITFAVGDWVIYNGSQWQKSAGSSGTVTSVAMTVPTGLSVTGSPITTSGTLALSLASGYTIPTTSFLSGLVPYTGATGNVNLGEYGLSGGYLGLDTTPTGTPTTLGTLSWDDTYLTPKVITGTGATTLQVGQEEVVLIHNNTGSTLTDGQVVYINGSTGNLPTVALADASSETTSAATLGVVTESIANGSNGFITISGNVNGLNTTGYTAGDILWLSETAGQFTNVKPVSPAHLVLIGYVVKVSGGNGSILVKIQNTQELEECSDVLFTSLANNDILAYESSTDLWKNKTIANVLGYTPANDSLVVHLAGNETITGSKTFSAATEFTSSQSVAFNYGLGIAKGNTPSIFSSSAVYLYSASGDNNLIIKDNTNTSKLQFQAASSYTYTFPASTGTVALTSDIPSLTGYVPYTGATSSLNLGNYGLTASSVFVSSVGTNAGQVQLKQGSVFTTPNGYGTFGSGGANDFYFYQNTSSVVRGAILSLGSITASATRTYTLPDADGTLALTSQIPSLSGYVQGSGTTNYHAKFTASSTIGNSMLTDDGTTLQSIGATRSNLYLKAASSSYYSQLAFTNGSNGSFGGISYNNSSQYMQFESNSSEWMRLNSDGKFLINGTSASNYFRLQVFHGSAEAGLLIKATNSGRYAPFEIRTDTNATQFTVLENGNVGIGTSSPNQQLTLKIVGSANSLISFQNSAGTATTYFGIPNANGDVISTSDVADTCLRNETGSILFATNGNNEKGRFTNAGYFKASNTGTYHGITGSYHEFRNNQNLPTLRITNSKTSGGEELFRQEFTGFAPNASNSWFIYSNDTSAARFYVSSNGGIGNFQANNVNLSDERTKKEISPLESYWDKFKAIEIVKFKYKDQTHDDFNIGVIAQQVEEIAPEFVDIDGFGKDSIPEDGIPLKTIYTADLHHATIKVLQEAMAKIEELEAKVSALENKS